MDIATIYNTEAIAVVSVFHIIVELRYTFRTVIKKGQLKGVMHKWKMLCVSPELM